MGHASMRPGHEAPEYPAGRRALVRIEETASMRPGHEAPEYDDAGAEAFDVLSASMRPGHEAPEYEGLQFKS